MRTGSMFVLCIVALGVGLRPASPDQADEPNRKLTPGSTATSDRATVCRRGYAQAVRPTGRAWRELKERAYNRYGLIRGHRSASDSAGHRYPSYAIDHLIPLELGGAPDDINNLWPQPRTASKRKDDVENMLHSLVCSGEMTLLNAQRNIAHDWKTAPLIEGLARLPRRTEFNE